MEEKEGEEEEEAENKRAAEGGLTNRERIGTHAPFSLNCGSYRPFSFFSSVGWHSRSAYSERKKMELENRVSSSSCFPSWNWTFHSITRKKAGSKNREENSVLRGNGLQSKASRQGPESHHLEAWGKIEWHFFFFSAVGQMTNKSVPVGWNEESDPSIYLWNGTILEDFERREMNNVVARPTATDGYEIDWRGKLDSERKKTIVASFTKGGVSGWCILQHLALSSSCYGEGRQSTYSVAPHRFRISWRDENSALQRYWESPDARCTWNAISTAEMCKNFRSILHKPTWCDFPLALFSFSAE